MGLKGSLGIKKEDVILKISLSLFYDHVIDYERNIIKNTGDWIGLDVPKYITDFYVQVEFSLGFML